MKRQTSFPPEWSLGDLAEHFGVSASRIRLTPTPGTATEKDVLRIQAKEDRLFELIDGVMVEKPMGMPESRLGLRLAFFLQLYLEDHDVGELGGADGPMRVMPEHVYLPDLSFTSHERRAKSATRDRPVPVLVPELAVEILSESNTTSEMTRKIKDYFFAGTTLVWLVDPHRFTINVYTAPDQSVTLADGDELTGDPVLPGFRVAVTRVFERVPRPAKPKRPRKKKP